MRQMRQMRLTGMHTYFYHSLVGYFQIHINVSVIHMCHTCIECIYLYVWSGHPKRTVKSLTFRKIFLNNKMCTTDLTYGFNWIQNIYINPRINPIWTISPTVMWGLSLSITQTIVGKKKRRDSLSQSSKSNQLKFGRHNIFTSCKTCPNIKTRD